MFTDIHRTIEKHKSLIDREVTILVIKEAREERDEVLRRYQEERADRELRMLKENIHPYDYALQLEEVQHKHCAKTGEWIFSNPQFLSWLDGGPNETEKRLLWLAGVPGAGNSHVDPKCCPTVNCMLTNRENLRLLFRSEISRRKSTGRWVD